MDFTPTNRAGVHPLCHEHRVELEFNTIFIDEGGRTRQVDAYTCPVRQCLLHYNDSLGYFVYSRRTGRIDTDSSPQVKCEHDGAPMYLAEILDGTKKFRMWKCPQCHMYVVAKPHSMAS